jgi:SPP1 family predicted phage head-tail adaptor
VTSGRLRDRIIVQRAVGGDDGYGNVINSWADHLTLWADVREALGKETVAAGRVEESRTATIRVRASTQSREITAADRLSVRGNIWNIRSISEVSNDRKLLEMLCEVGVA